MIVIFAEDCSQHMIIVVAQMRLPDAPTEVWQVRLPRVASSHDVRAAISSHAYNASTLPPYIAAARPPLPVKLYIDFGALFAIECRAVELG